MLLSLGEIFFLPHAPRVHGFAYLHCFESVFGRTAPSLTYQCDRKIESRQFLSSVFRQRPAERRAFLLLVLLEENGRSRRCFSGKK